MSNWLEKIRNASEAKRRRLMYIIIALVVILLLTIWLLVGNPEGPKRQINNDDLIQELNDTFRENQTDLLNTIE